MLRHGVGAGVAGAGAVGIGGGLHSEGVDFVLTGHHELASTTLSLPIFPHFFSNTFQLVI